MGKQSEYSERVNEFVNHFLFRKDKTGFVISQRYMRVFLLSSVTEVVTVDRVGAVG
jgi:hypothetical protein